MELNRSEAVQRANDPETRTHEPSTAEPTGVYRETSHTGNGTSNTPVDAPRIPGYEIEREIARGGMGRVYAARDRTLDREVAIKTLLPGANANRFVTETKITAQLQHPGIPPVHAMGTLDDGSPYLVMKLIRGRTLAELIRDPAWDRGSLPAIFESIAQAVAAAHERRIVHRDLKPGNVMVGSFGEVQVMDWGLAKRLGDAEDSSSDTPADDESSATRAGSALGTPGYMPPEQARGDLAAIDERSDVFGLGAILGTLLTGRPPFVGDSVSATLAKAAAGNLEDARQRLDASGADPEFIRLARHCLRADPADRPRDAGEVARDVHSIRIAADERARQAELDRVRTEGERREADRRRRARRVLVGALLALVAVVAGAAWIVRDQRYERQRQAERAALAVETALGQMPGYFDRSLWADALRALDDGEKLLGSDADPALRARIERARAEATFLRELEEVRLLKATFKDYAFASDEALKRYKSAFEAPAAFGPTPLAIFADDRTETAARLRESPIRDHVVAALDDWAFALNDPAKARSIFQLTADVTGQEWRRDFPPQGRDPSSLKKRLDAVPVAERTPALIGQIGLMIEQSGGNGIPVIHAGLTRYPNDFWLHMYLAFAAREPNAKSAALRAAIALRPDTFGAHIYLISSLIDGPGITPEHHRAALDVAERTHRLWPERALTHNYLGAAHLRFAHYAEAEHHYRKAVELEKGNIAYLHWNGVGLVLRDAGRWEDALEAYRSGAAVAPATDPYLVGNTGEMLLLLGRAREAITPCREAIRRGMPGPGALVGLGTSYLALDDATEAEVHFRRAEGRAGAREYLLMLAESIASRDAKSMVANKLRERAARLNPAAGSSFDQQVARLKAESKTEELRALLERTYKDQTRNWSIAYHYAAFHFDERDFAKAERGYRRVAELRPDVCSAHCNWGAALVQLRRYDEAIKAYEKGVEVDPKDAGARFWLANAYNLAKRPKDALASIRESVRINPDDPNARELLKNLESEMKNEKERK